MLGREPGAGLGSEACAEPGLDAPASALVAADPADPGKSLCVISDPPIFSQVAERSDGMKSRPRPGRDAPLGTPAGSGVHRHSLDAQDSTGQGPLIGARMAN